MADDSDSPVGALVSLVVMAAVAYLVFFSGGNDGPVGQPAEVVNASGEDVIREVRYHDDGRNGPMLVVPLNGGLAGDGAAVTVTVYDADGERVESSSATLGDAPARVEVTRPGVSEIEWEPNGPYRLVVEVVPEDGGQSYTEVAVVELPDRT